MIELELQRVPEGGREYEVAARLRVSDDRDVELDDPEGLVPTSLHVLVATPAGGFTKVCFDDDPVTWVRNLDSLLRTGYLVPVITRDDVAVESAEG